MANTNLTAQHVRALFDYNPETGHLIRRTKRSNQMPGSVCQTKCSTGHLSVMIDYKNYAVHRIAWLHFYGTWPEHVIDHINGDPADNRIANLRDVPQAINTQNQRAAKSNNQVKLLGVSRNRKRWRATIQVDGKWQHIGTFNTPEQAHEAYLVAKRKHHAGSTI